ncbi:MAG: hypothetical protein O7G87_14335 [bacterium]|nr:hypothetical protein [bacterium]
MELKIVTTVLQSKAYGISGSARLAAQRAANGAGLAPQNRRPPRCRAGGSDEAEERGIIGKKTITDCQYFLKSGSLHLSILWLFLCFYLTYIKILNILTSSYFFIDCQLFFC